MLCKFAGVSSLLLICLLPCLVMGQARKLMPGDRIEIVCDESPMLCVTRTIGLDGAVSVPGFGPVGVAARGAAEAAKRIADLLVDSGTMDRATIRVIPLETPDAPVAVSGSVEKAFEIRYAHPLKLSELLLSARPASAADLSNIAISRADGSARVVDSTKMDLILLPGDRVYVPLAPGGVSVNVLGGVLKPCAVDFKRGMTLQEAIQAAGGLSGYGNPNQVVVERRGEPFPVTLPDDGSLPLKAGDTIRVSLRPEKGTVAVRGNVLRTGLVDYAPGMTVTQVIRAAGGLKPGTLAGEVIIRTVIGKRQRSIKLSLPFIYAKRIPDPVVSPDDVIEVAGGMGG